ncbi:P-loop containing nucleoside triphosphate hydrolase protein [Scleroderma citrinum]
MAKLQDEDYVDIGIRNEPEESTLNSHQVDVFYEKWIDQASGRHTSPHLTVPHVLHKLYPGHSLVTTDDARLDLLSFPEVQYERIPSSKEVTNVVFAGVPRHDGSALQGRLVEKTVYGSYRMTWKDEEFIVYIVKVPEGPFFKVMHVILHSGAQEPARDLVLSAILFHEKLHDEIWVFDRGHWSKDKSLWSAVQNSTWDDIIIKDNYKEVLMKDIYGFFEAQELYKKVSIPWKRGLVMYGPPGNGKTITIKAVIKTCAERGFIPLYVKSFRDPRGEEVAVQHVFEKARQMSPCVLILEDLDSLIDNNNRSYFLNQLDGLEGNDGLLVIGTTNHFEKLDPSLSNRPSRFDRKYHFDNPDQEERALYAKYWQNKLKDNEEIPFSNDLVEEIASITAGFSFSHLKEVFVSALVGMTNSGGSDKTNFTDVLKNQVTVLQKELGKQPFCKEGASSKGNAEINALASIAHPEMIPTITTFKSCGRGVSVEREQPKSRGTQKIVRDASNTVVSTESNPPVLRIKFDPRAESSRAMPSQTASLFAAPPCAYPQAVRPMPGTLPIQEPLASAKPFGTTAPKQL